MSLEISISYVGPGISFEKKSFCAEVEFDPFSGETLARLSWVNGPVSVNSWVPLNLGWRFIAREARWLRSFVMIH